MIVFKKAISRRAMLRGTGRRVGAAAAGQHGAGVFRARRHARQAGQPLRRHLRAERHDHAELSALDRRHGYELTPTLSALAPFREHFQVLSGLTCVPHAGAAGRRARESQHAVSDRYFTAHQRNLARCRHLGRPDSRAGDGQAHAVGVARTGD